MKLLLNEMYSPALAQSLRGAGINCQTVLELGLTGISDIDLFEAAVAQGYTVLTENVADFVQICADCIKGGRHHSGVLIALSTRFSQRPAGMSSLVSAVLAVSSEIMEDQIVYLRHSP